MVATTALGNSVLQAKLDDARARTDELFRLLRPGAIYERPVPERHRLIFYLGHLEAFDWNQVCRGALGMPSFHAAFDKLFEFGIDPEPGKAAADIPSDWPSVAEIETYNATVRRKLDDVLAEAPEQIVHVALEHRQMHAETLAYLFHELDYKHKESGPIEAISHGSAPLTHLIDIPAGTATLGQNFGEFGWDNEFAQHSVEVPGFAISKYKITNGEYLGFVRQGAPIPHFWVQRDGEFFYRGMFGLIPLPLDWPVYVTHDEAVAYATWKALGLPSEAQFHRAAYGSTRDDDRASHRAYPWGDSEPTIEHGNFDFHHWDTTTVESATAGDSAFGVSQLVGNGWEWTSTVFGPFEGFRAFDFYPGYSANFFDGAHYVMKGGSPRTAAGLLRKSFRNWFRPNYPYVYASFRLVEN